MLVIKNAFHRNMGTYADRGIWTGGADSWGALTQNTPLSAEQPGGATQLAHTSKSSDYADSAYFRQQVEESCYKDGTNR